MSAGALLQTPLGELTALPRPPSWIWGGEEKREDEGGKEGKGRKGKGERGRGKLGREKGRGKREGGR